MTIKNSTLIIDGHSLTIKDVHRTAYAPRGESSIQLGEKSIQSIEKAHALVFQIAGKNKPVYGINTGFGALSDKRIGPGDLQQLQLNLIRSHCTGVGQPFSREITRAIMLLRANCLASGYSGVSLKAVQMILDFLNNDITPVVPQKGSVGASGDLAPLSHIALALIGEGEVEFQEQITPSGEAIASLGKKPLHPGPKDGLALINGTAVMTALGAMAVVEGARLAILADILGAMTLEGLKGSLKAYDQRLSHLKPHPGQAQSAANVTHLIADSEILKSHQDCAKVQDPYSLRCIPQVHGACRQTLEHCREVIERELNSVTDNPLIFPDQEEIISGGNFHGEALALAMDYLAMGISELGNISERRIEKMMNPTFSELPPFLTQQSGLNSGLMMAHVTAAALASENKGLCHPASVDSIPTSTDKEDHVSMGVTAGHQLHQVVENVYHILAIELLCNTQAIEFHRPLKTGPGLEEAIRQVRKLVHPIEEDRIFYRDMNSLYKLIKDEKFITTIESQIGKLQ